MKTTLTRLLPLLLLLARPAAVQAQFNFTTNGETLTITGYTGLGGAVIIPGTTNLLRVIAIGSNAFSLCTTLTSVSIPDNITSIGDHAFYQCTGLTNVTVGTNLVSIGDYAFRYCTGLAGVAPIPNGVTNLGPYAFGACTKLTQVAIPSTVTNIGEAAFWSCTALTNVTLGPNVTRLGDGAFASCTSLTSVALPASVVSLGDYALSYCASLTSIYCQGNPPSLGGPSVFSYGNTPTIYYLPGKPAWNPRVQTGDPSFGVRTNQFGFSVTGTDGMAIVIAASSGLAHSAWSPVATNTFSGGSSYFSDPQWTNYPARLYRLVDLTFGGLPTARWNP